MMRPPPTLRMYGITSREHQTAAMSLRSRSSCHSASVTSSNFLAADLPALLTRISIRPKRLTVRVTNFSSSSRLVTSAGWAKTSPPLRAVISAAARSSISRRRAQIATFTPSRARHSATPLPIPSLPPVMIATLPLSPKSISSPSPEERWAVPTLLLCAKCSRAQTPDSELQDSRLLNRPVIGERHRGRPGVRIGDHINHRRFARGGSPL